MPRRSRSLGPLILFLGTVLVSALAACGTMERGPTEERIASVGDAMPGAPAAMDAVASKVAGVAAAPTAPLGGQVSAARDSVPLSMIIRTGFASVQVDSLEVAVAAVKALTTRLGGYVGNVQMQTGESQIRSATIEIRLPAARYDEALGGLTPLGKVESVNTTAEDVGEEFVDVNARVANSRRLEDRLVSLLANRTGKLEDVLAVERELARVREEIDRYEGRLRFLRTRVSLSTLTVNVHERAPLVSNSPGTSVIGEAFRDAWRNFVRFIAAFIASLGWLLPLGALVGALVIAARRLLALRRSRPAPPDAT